MSAQLTRTSKSTIFNQVANIPQNMSANSPESIILIQKYLEQQKNIKCISKRLAFYTIKGQKLEKSSKLEDKLELKKIETNIEEFVEDYVEANKANLETLKTSEGLKRLMFARLSRACEKCYTASIMGADKKFTSELKKAAREAQKDSELISKILI